MGRPEYTVAWDNGAFIKYSWNTARANIRAVLRKMLFKGEEFSCISFDGERDESGGYVKGKEIWASIYGRKIEFTILRTKERA